MPKSLALAVAAAILPACVSERPSERRVRQPEPFLGVEYDTPSHGLVPGQLPR